MAHRPPAAGPAAGRSAREPPQVRHLEGLDEDGVTCVAIAVPFEHADQGRVQVQAVVGEVRRVLRLHVEPDPASERTLLSLDELDDLVERRDPEPAVERRVGGTHIGDALDRPEPFDLRQGEVFAEPAGERHPVDDLGGALRRELRPLCHIGGEVEDVVVPRHERAVSGHDEVGLHVVGTHVDGELVGGQGVFRAVAARTPVRDHERRTRKGKPTVDPRGAQRRALPKVAPPNGATSATSATSASDESRRRITALRAAAR